MTSSIKNPSLVVAVTLALALSLGACGGGGGNGPVTDGDGMMPEPIPEPEPDPQALAGAIELVASWVKDADNNTIGGWWRRDLNGSGNQENLGHSHRVGSRATTVVSWDEDGPQLNVGLFQTNDAQPLQTDPWAQAHRYISTYDIGDDPEGVTTSREVRTDHDLGSAWHVEELRRQYTGAGTLEIGIATDVESTDGAVDQWQTETGRSSDIMLDGTPDLPPDRDFLIVWLPDGGTADGSLGDVEGSFACEYAGGCAFVRDRGDAGFSAFDSVSFTPDGGTAQSVTPLTPGPTGAADWLAFGYWLYVPEDAMAAEDYDFGMFASGGDPFEAPNLAGLTGSATYAGSAAGWYYVDESSSSPASGQFSASVALTADFGDGTETGTVTGTLSGFDWPDAVAASLPETVAFTSDNWKGNTERYGFDYAYDEYETVRGESNIFDSIWTSGNWTAPAPWRGGHVLGFTEANVDGTHWNGEWNSAFFGNGASSTDHPTSIAGTFHASDNATAGLTGSFGAHRQQQ